MIHEARIVTGHLIGPWLQSYNHTVDWVSPANGDWKLVTCITEAKQFPDKCLMRLPSYSDTPEYHYDGSTYTLSQDVLSILSTPAHSPLQLEFLSLFLSSPWQVEILQGSSLSYFSRDCDQIPDKRQF